MPEDFEKELKAAKAWDYDIASSRLEPRLLEGGLPKDIAEAYARKVGEILAFDEPRSPEELAGIIQMLDTAIAINNHPKARELREYLFQKFGK